MSGRSSLRVLIEEPSTLLGRALPRNPCLTVSLADIWFESDGGTAQLMVAIDLPLKTMRFRADVAGVTLLFSHFADIKGRRLFAASAPRLGDDPGQSEQGPLWRLSGPFQRGPQGVS
jgi:hypothetical protein